MISFSPFLVLWIITLIPPLVCFISSQLSKSKFNDREKITPFECGFDQMSSSRLPFSIQFFMTSLLFLIFDIEIVLILPIIYMSESMSINSILVFTSFILTLIISLYMEWAWDYLMWI